MYPFRRIGLLVGDAAEAKAIKEGLRQSGFECIDFRTIEEVVGDQGEDGGIDLLLLGSRIGDIGVLAALDRLENSWTGWLPVILVGNGDDESEVVWALESGVDDYVASPRRIGELGARISALSRRQPGWTPRCEPAVIELGVYRLERADRLASVRGTEVRLSPKVFDLAVLLFSNVGRVVRVDELERRLWGEDFASMSRRLPVLVSRLRGALSLYPRNGLVVSAIGGHSYRLCEVSVDLSGSLSAPAHRHVT